MAIEISTYVRMTVRSTGKTFFLWQTHWAAHSAQPQYMLCIIHSYNVNWRHWLWQWIIVRPLSISVAPTIIIESSYLC